MDDKSVSTDRLPIVLVRGWGGLDVSDEQRLTHQGFNIGTVYPHRKGPNYIYEGLILRFLKDKVYPYQDATNVLRYAPGKGVVIDENNELVDRFTGVSNSLWIFRYYDFEHRELKYYGEQLAACIALVKDITKAPKVNIIAHSMGGLITRWTLQRVYKKREKAQAHVNKVVTLGTPHGGINFAQVTDILPVGFELKNFSRRWLNRELGGEHKNCFDISDSFSPRSTLCIVGTNRWSYVPPSKFLTGKKSDGLVQQANAKVKDAYTAHVHKCHSGHDSLVTSREAYELATRFFFGDRLITITRTKGRIIGRHELLGQPEYYVGHSLKPRGVDFFLNRQSKEGENCEGAFTKNKLPDNQVVYRGFLDSRRIVSAAKQDISFRFDIYVGERDILGLLGFSDTILVNHQCSFTYLIERQALRFSPYLLSADFIADAELPPSVDVQERPGEQMHNGGIQFGPFAVRYPTYEAEYSVTVENVSD